MLLRTLKNGRSKLIRRFQSSHVKNIGNLVSKGRVVFSGIQPTGIPHLGNYLGALKLWVDLQKDPGDIFYSIVDLHALTIKREEKISQRTLEMTACLLACGIDPNRSVVFKQSDVPEHGALSWILGCLVQHNVMKHLIQWKEKSRTSEGAGNVGLFTYPILQCADILLYKATHVPVGNDQKQHLELCEDIVKSFNRIHGEFFRIPKYLEDSNSTKIRSLRDPFSKMSKSERSNLGKINLTDTDDEIWNKIKRAVTDATSAVSYDLTRRPGVSNLIQIHCGVTGMSVEEICLRAEKEELNTGQYKIAVAEAVIEHIRPVRTEYEKLMCNKHYLEETLTLGGEKAKTVAAKTWADIVRLIGLK